MIDTSTWTEFRVGDLFDIHPTKAYKLTNAQLLDDGDYPVIANSAYDNGIGGYSTKEPTEKGNMVTFSDTVDANTIFYQPNDFVGYPHVQGLYPLMYEGKWNEYTYSFFVSAFRGSAISKGFDYGNKFRRDIAVDLIIKLPATSDGQPDWGYMESYMKTIMEESEKSLENLKRADGTKHLVNVSEWGEFDVSDFFTVLSGRNKLSNVDIDDGDTPVYSSNSFNGGIFGYTTKEPDYIVDETNPFYVTFGDHTKAVNIADKSFCVMDNVKVLTTEIHNYNILLFIITSWLRNIPDLGYARHWSIAETSKIHLPITVDSEPDWRYMEDYMKRQFNEAELAVSQLQLAV